MTFTDDDLKRLKEEAKAGDSSHTSPEEISALLARLEAAEAYIYARSDNPYLIAARYDAWRKACGK